MISTSSKVLLGRGCATSTYLFPSLLNNSLERVFTFLFVLVFGGSSYAKSISFGEMDSFLLFGFFHDSRGGNGELTFGCAVIFYDVVTTLTKVVVTIGEVLVKTTFRISTLDTWTKLDMNYSKSKCDAIPKDGEDRLNKDMGEPNSLSKPHFGLSKGDPEIGDECIDCIDIGVTSTGTWRVIMEIKKIKNRWGYGKSRRRYNINNGRRQDRWFIKNILMRVHLCFLMSFFLKFPFLLHRLLLCFNGWFFWWLLSLLIATLYHKFDLGVEGLLDLRASFFFLFLNLDFLLALPCLFLWYNEKIFQLFSPFL